MMNNVIIVLAGCKEENMQRIKTQIMVLFAALTLALGGAGAFVATQAVTGTTEDTSAHTAVVAYYCGSDISPNRQVKVAYHPYAGSVHYYYWRSMTAQEYWTYCW